MSTDDELRRMKALQELVKDEWFLKLTPEKRLVREQQLREEAAWEEQRRKAEPKEQRREAAQGFALSPEEFERRREAVQRLLQTPARGAETKLEVGAVRPLLSADIPRCLWCSAC